MVPHRRAAAPDIVVAMTAWVREHRSGVARCAAVAAPLAVAAVLVPFRGTFAGAAAALVLIAVVVAVAVTGDRISGVVAAAASALWFDLLLTRPYDRLAISHRADIETAISLLVVGVVVTELAARSRHHHRVASEESGFVALLRELTDLAASPAPADLVIERATATLRELLSLRECHFEQGPVRGARARIDSDGELVNGDILWPVADIGIPAPGAEIVASWRGEAMGRFVLTPTPGLPIPLERRAVAVVVADLVGATLGGGRPDARGGRPAR